MGVGGLAARKIPPRTQIETTKEDLVAANTSSVHNMAVFQTLTIIQLMAVTASQVLRRQASARDRPLMMANMTSPRLLCVT
jgi:hypothetical protein